MIDELVAGILTRKGRFLVERRRLDDDRTLDTWRFLVDTWTRANL